MPLLKTLNYDPIARVYLWKIDETLEELQDAVTLHPSDQKKYDSLNHLEKQREFLALRSCLSEHFGENPEVHYYATGKPYLKSPEKISFSHTWGYAAAIVSQELEVGLDLELYRPGIQKVARKYMRVEESNTLKDDSSVEHLLSYWGAKEAMIKITGNRRLDFRKQLRVAPYFYSDYMMTEGAVFYDDHHKPMRFVFEQVGEVFICMGWEWNW